MDRVLVAVDAEVQVSARDLAQAWNEDAAAGSAQVEAATGELFAPGVIELVVLPLAMGLTTNALYALIHAAFSRARRGKQVSEVDIVEHTSANGDRIVIVRARREVS